MKHVYVTSKNVWRNLASLINKSSDYVISTVGRNILVTRNNTQNVTYTLSPIVYIKSNFLNFFDGWTMIAGDL